MRWAARLALRPTTGNQYLRCSRTKANDSRAVQHAGLQVALLPRSNTHSTLSVTNNPKRSAQFPAAGVQAATLLRDSQFPKKKVTAGKTTVANLPSR